MHGLLLQELGWLFRRFCQEVRSVWILNSVPLSIARGLKMCFIGLKVKRNSDIYNVSDTMQNTRHTSVIDFGKTRSQPSESPTRHRHCKILQVPARLRGDYIFWSFCWILWTYHPTSKQLWVVIRNLDSEFQSCGISSQNHVPVQRRAHTWKP